MFSIFSNSGQINYGQKQYLLDFESDIAELPANATPGDIAFVIETSKYYMLNHQKQWVKVTLANGGSGGGDTPIDEIVYNGGLV